MALLQLPQDGGYGFQQKIIAGIAIPFVILSRVYPGSFIYHLMKNITLITSLALILLTSSCKWFQREEPADSAEKSTEITAVVVQDSAFRQLVRNEHMVLATLYQQTAAEYRALCYQAFNIGKIMLDLDLADKSVNKHRVIVLDVDETVLDNSPFQAKSVLESTSYPVNWDEWCNLARAEALPGALDFLKYARANGVSIFYVTNRKDYLKDVTVKNLAALGFPHADEEHVITRTAEASKEGRRQTLAAKYHISLLFGDNLNDFAEDFEGLAVKPRMEAVDHASAEFGRRFIVLPNAMYGDWENALYNYSPGAGDSVRFQFRRKALRSF